MTAMRDAVVEVKIDSLSLNIENVAGHEHRIQPIAVHAAARFAEQLQERLAEGRRVPVSRDIAALHAEPLGLSLAHMSDDQAAERVATAWLTALVSTLKL